MTYKELTYKLWHPYNGSMITLTYKFFIKNGVFFYGFEASHVFIEIEQPRFQKRLFFKLLHIPTFSLRSHHSKIDKIKVSNLYSCHYFNNIWLHRFAWRKWEQLSEETRSKLLTFDLKHSWFNKKNKMNEVSSQTKTLLYIYCIANNVFLLNL